MDCPGAVLVPSWVMCVVKELDDEGMVVRKSVENACLSACYQDVEGEMRVNILLISGLYVLYVALNPVNSRNSIIDYGASSFT